MMKRLKNIFKMVIFVIILLLGVSGLEDVFENKSTEAVSKDYELYEKDFFDVMFFGTSITKYGIYPMVLYKDFGIAAYNLSSGAQSIPSSYYLIEKAIEEQSPKVVVLDCFAVTYQIEKYYSEAHLHYVTDMMDFFERYRMVSDLIEDNKKAEFLFPMLKYHSRWSELTEWDFSYTEYASLGARMSFTTTEIQAETEILQESVELPEVSKTYLVKIIELCKEKEVDLVLTLLPMDFGYGTECDASQMQKYINGVQAIADEYDIPYLNFMHDMEETGIDYATDFRDRRHMNCYGATKMTTYLGKYLKANYDLPDVRGNSRYAFLKDEYKVYKTYYEESLLHAETDIYRYFSLLSEMEDYTVFISVKDIQGYALTEEITDLMQEAGFAQAETLLERVYHGYIGIVSDGRCVYEAISNEHASLEYRGSLYEKDILIVSQTLNGGNKSSIMLDEKEYSKNRRGLNIVVISNEIGEIVDSVCFDTHTKELKCIR